MFTINIYLKLALIAVFLIGGIVLSFTNGLIYSWPLLLVGLILLASYIFLGTVQSAAQMIQDGNIDEAEQRLDLTKFPGMLYVTNRAMYYIMRGSIATQRQDNKTAEGLFDKALSLKLPSDNERGMVLLQLANINATKEKWNVARKYYKEAEKLDITESQLKTQLIMFGKAIKNRGQVKMARTMGKQGMRMMQGGGSNKRRRPRMR